MTYDEYRNEMRKLGWNDKEINRYIELFEKLIHEYPAYKEELKLEYFLKKPSKPPKPPVIYSASFSDETMKKYSSKSEENS